MSYSTRDLVKRFSCRTRAPHIIKPFPDALSCAGLGSEIKKPLTGFRAAAASSNVAASSQDRRPPGFLEVTEKFRRMVAECGHCRNLLCDIRRVLFPVDRIR
jgi:hypothetical protein